MRLSLKAFLLMSANSSRERSMTTGSISASTTRATPLCLSASAAMARSPPPTISTDFTLPCSKIGRWVSISE